MAQLCCGMESRIKNKKANLLWIMVPPCSFACFHPDLT